MWEVEGQHEWIGACVFDFYTTVRKCGLRDESDLGINLTELHVLVISHFELANATASTICMEQCGTLRAEIRLAARLQYETEN